MATQQIDPVSLEAARKKHADLTLDQIFDSLDDGLSTAPARAQVEVAPQTAPQSNDSGFRAEGEFTDSVLARRYILGGKATITLVSKKTGIRFTFRISKPKDDGRPDNGFRFVSVLNGPDNWTNYAYFGFIRPTGVFFHGGAKAKVAETAASAKAFAWAWQKLASGVLPESLQVWHEGQCARCGRKLTVPSSVASGFGPECLGRMEGGDL